jgi:hypothetical protein
MLGKNGGIPGFLRAPEIKLQKAVDRIRGRPYMALTDAALTASTATATTLRSPVNSDSRSPGVNRGTMRCPPFLSGGSLTSLVFDEGTCGRRRPVRGPQGSGNRLTQADRHIRSRAPRLLGWQACSFVSITFDSAGIGSLQLMPVWRMGFSPCLIGV